MKGFYVQLINWCHCCSTKTHCPVDSKCEEICITGVITPSAPIQEGEWDEISEARAHYNSKEDPGVVRHDTEHQHVAQSHLQKVEEHLDNVKQPAEKQIVGKYKYLSLPLRINVTSSLTRMCILTRRWVSESCWPVLDVHSKTARFLVC